MSKDGAIMKCKKGKLRILRSKGECKRQVRKGYEANISPDQILSITKGRGGSRMQNSAQSFDFWLSLCTTSCVILSKLLRETIRLHFLIYE